MSGSRRDKERDEGTQPAPAAGPVLQVFDRGRPTPLVEVRCWGEAGGACAAEELLLLPYGPDRAPIPDLPSVLRDPRLGGSLRLVLGAEQAAEDPEALRGSAPGSLLVLQGRTAAEPSPGFSRPYWQLLVDLLGHLASPRRVAVLHPEAWPLGTLTPSELSLFEKRLLELSIGGLQVLASGSSGSEVLRPYAVPPCAAADPTFPEISIVLPVYNAERFLAEAIGSIRAQSAGDFELLCIDDGSTDGSAAILRSAAAEDPRIRVLSQANEGVSSARNRGLEEARGRFVCFVDADDIMLPGSLERRLERLSAPGELVCGGRAVFVDDAGRDLGMSFGRTDRVWYAGSFTMPFHLTSLMGQAHIMKRARFPEGIAHAEDWAYLVDILRAGWSVAGCGEAPLIAYRWHLDSTTGANSEAHLAGCLRLLDRLPALAPQPLLEMERPPGALQLSARRVVRAKVRRLQAHFVALALAGEEKALRELAADPALSLAPARAKWLDEDFFDVAAVRTFRLPRHSPELDRAVAERLDRAFESCALLPRDLPNRAFSLRFRSYLLRCAGRSGAGPGLAVRRLRLRLDRVGVGVAATLRRLGRGLARSG